MNARFQPTLIHVAVDVSPLHLNSEAFRADSRRLLRIQGADK